MLGNMCICQHTFIVSSLLYYVPHASSMLEVEHIICLIWIIGVKLLYFDLCISFSVAAARVSCSNKYSSYNGRYLVLFLTLGLRLALRRYFAANTPTRLSFRLLITIISISSDNAIPTNQKVFEFEDLILYHMTD